MEDLQKAYKKASVVATMLIISAVVLAVSAAVVGIMGKWILHPACAVPAILLAAICDEVCHYKDWLKATITEMEKPLIMPWYACNWDGDKIVVKFDFERFMTLYSIDQKNAWTIGPLCSYEQVTREEKPIEKEAYRFTTCYTHTLRAHVWFGFFDYLKFKRILKNREARAEQKKQEKQHAHEIELCKEFIQALEKDVKSYAENGPFKEENHD